jgi:hypothetical protein
MTPSALYHILYVIVVSCVDVIEGVEIVLLLLLFISGHLDLIAKVSHAREFTLIHLLVTFLFSFVYFFLDLSLIDKVRSVIEATSNENISIERDKACKFIKLAR